MSDDLIRKWQLSRRRVLAGAAGLGAAGLSGAAFGQPSGPWSVPPKSKVDRVNFVVWTYGQVELQFQYLATKPPLDRLEEREQFRARLCSSLEIEIPPEKLDKRPSFPLSVLSAPARRADFESAILEVIDRFKGATTT